MARPLFTECPGGEIADNSIPYMYFMCKRFHEATCTMYKVEIKTGNKDDRMIQQLLSECNQMSLK